ncbi:MAG: hypothetical protein IT385_02095 [Deltaproteobacteria bacterium]|nr:hypothetical protein [Deltaproteobacteria bacterium]
MRPRIALMSALALVASAPAGCVRQVWSPPAGYVPLEGPAPIAPGEVRVGGALGGGGVGIGADLVGGAVRYRRGLEHVEVQGEVAAAIVAEDSEAKTFPAIISARAGMKGLLVPGFRHASWRLGAGLGGSAGGLFGALDGGFVIGFDNPWVVPWAEVGGGVSVPFTSEDVDITKPDDDEAVVDHPVTTILGRVGLGVAVHIGPWATTSLGIAWVFLNDIHGIAEQVTQIGLSVDVPL